jgi:hypothetical protein
MVSGNQPAPSWWDRHWRAVVGVALFVVLLAIFFAVSQTATTAAAGGEAAGLLALIAAAAIGIERVIEGFWSVMGQLKNSWWPLNEMAARVGALETDVNGRLTDVYANVEAVIKASGRTGEWVDSELAKARTEIDSMQRRIQELQGLAPGNQQINLFAATALQNIAMLEQKYPDIKASVGVANQAIAGLTDFAASFKENPARRMFSLLAGAILGLILAWVLRLDVFSAVFGSTPQAPLLPYVGVALTGLLIGLGSGPTHDVVAVLQEVKKLRATQNQPGPSAVEVGPAVVEAGGEVAVGARGVAAPERPVTRRFR